RQQRRGLQIGPGCSTIDPILPPRFHEVPFMPGRRLAVVMMLLFLTVQGVRADEEVAGLLKDLRAVSAQGAGSSAARAAWDRLVARGPSALPAILQALDTPDTVAANWLRTAFDRIVEQEMKTGGKKINIDALLAFVKDAKRQGRA